MIVIKIKGGLGNQLFQYAIAKAFSLETKRKFKLDISLIEGATIKDISGQSVPQDFRNKKIHFCFKIEKN